MRIAAILESPATYGGSFHQGVNAIFQMEKICGDEFQFCVITTIEKNVFYLENLGINTFFFKLTFRDKIILWLMAYGFFKLIQRKFKFISPFERFLLKRKIDLVYVLTQSTLPLLLARSPFITTAYDICHRDFPEFPEVREYHESYFRDQCFINTLASASLIITDSNELSQKLIAKYGVDIGRTIAMPYSPSDLRECVSSAMNDVLGSYQISEGYFFYPAQFWAHKNHARIINAIKILKAQGAKVKVVFAGGDKGNVSYIKALALEAEVLDQIHFLGFVPQEHMRGLYMGSLAVLMPTYFGPTNLPAFEAWTLDKPLIYSSHLSAHAGKAAIYSDPDNAEELALSMQKCEDAKIVEELIKQGQLRLQKFSSERSQAEAQLKAFIQKFAARRQCWR